MARLGWSLKRPWPRRKSNHCSDQWLWWYSDPKANLFPPTDFIDKRLKHTHTHILPCFGKTLFSILLHFKRFLLYFRLLWLYVIGGWTINICSDSFMSFSVATETTTFSVGLLISDSRTWNTAVWNPPICSLVKSLWVKLNKLHYLWDFTGIDCKDLWQGRVITSHKAAK